MPDFPVTGTLTATPAHPGPQRGDSPRERPVADATVTLTSDGITVATTVTDAAGRFRLTVPPGRYDVTATGTGAPAGATARVTVTGPTTVALVVDSGMR